MNIEQQIPRNALVWLLLAQFTLLLPHVERLPLWILLVFGIAGFWRMRVLQGSWSFPPRWVKNVLAVSSLVGIYVHYKSFIGLEPTVALLLMSFALKLIELSSRRDAYVILFLSYFVVLTEFLFEQTLLISVYMFATVTVVTSALIALHHSGENSFSFSPMRQSLIIFCQALPLMLVLFIIFPRFEPLWTVSLKTHSAKTGMSDVISPGDIASLSQDDSLAFRAKFESDIPPNNDLYWRGLVFSIFDGRAWRVSNTKKPFLNTNRPYLKNNGEQQKTPDRSINNSVLKYSIIMEPTQQRWLYGIREIMPPILSERERIELAELEQRIEQGVGQGIGQDLKNRQVLLNEDGTLFSTTVLSHRFAYEVKSFPLTTNHNISDEQRRQSLLFPKNINLRTQSLAKKWRATSGSDREFIETVLSMFRQEDFYYTLKPPLLGEQAIDEFLFDTRRGFCEHYASAFTLLMRAAGIPANVVGGYQGGEINPLNETVLVYQYDAHAWSEVWLQGEGWVRFDPTAAVSPARTEFGLEQAMKDAGEEGSFLSGTLLSTANFRHFAWLKQLGYRWDMLNYYWTRFALGYDNSSQIDLLRAILGKITVQRVALLLFIVTAMVLLVSSYFLLFKRLRSRTITPVEKLYQYYCEKLYRAGYPLKPGEGPVDYGNRIGVIYPDIKKEVSIITLMFTRFMYAEKGNGAKEKQNLSILKKHIKALKC